MKENNDVICCFSLQPLFIKPLYYPGSILYSKSINAIDQKISFRSLNLDTDLDLVHRWVNMDYAVSFWQLDGDKQKVFDNYYSVLRNSHGHSFLGLLNEIPVCQFDVYRIWADEIHQHITVNENACGFHLLMAPNVTPIPGLSLAVTLAFLDYYFSFPEASIMYAEPDVLNLRANTLLRKAGFHLIREIKMSYKTANLYSLNKQLFYEKDSIS